MLCKVDYIRLYGTKCSKCCHPITHSDWIRKAHDQVMMMIKTKWAIRDSSVTFLIIRCSTWPALLATPALGSCLQERSSDLCVTRYGILIRRRYVDSI